MPSKISKAAKKLKSLCLKVGRFPAVLINSAQRARFIYCRYYEKSEVEDNVIFVEAFHGDEISGNPFYLLREIYRDKRFNEYEIYVGSNKKQRQNIRDRLDAHGMDKVQVISRNSKKYCHVLATAKYIINDVSLPEYFIKKEGQVYLNTWHGTPLKGLGRNIMDSPNSIGNVQRNFLMTDYLLCPNKYTLEKLRDDYMLTYIYNGQYLLSGYPRNDVLFNKKRSAKVKNKLGLNDKKIVVYMPTYRDKKSDEDTYHFDMLMEILEELDNNVSDDIVVIAKLHHLAQGNIDFSKFSRVIPFPNGYETYEVLCTADCLITDYSSVMFDFANTGKKIILHAYDCEEYQNTRSMYMHIESLPFVITENISDLVKEVNAIEQYGSYTDAIHDYVAYDHPKSSKALIDYVFFGKKSEHMEVIDGSSYHNGKENVLIFTGALAKNGMTSALRSLMNMIDSEKRNYFLLFVAQSVNSNKMTIHDFSKYSYIPIQGRKVLYYREAFGRFIYYFLRKDFKFAERAMDSIMKREVKRLFNGIQFDYLIHYSGYERNIMEMFSRMDGQKAIYVHNDLIAESKTKDNINTKCIEKAYNRFDKIVAIREGTKEELVCSSEEIRNKVVLTHNLIDYKNIIAKAELPLVFDTCSEFMVVKHKTVPVTAITECNVSQDELEQILDDNSIIKFINIGRFSYEKGHVRLIEAFEKVRAKYDNVKLIIIGGYGSIYEDVLKRAQDSEYSSDIIIIRSLSNVFPVLKKCSVFVLSSYYEGLPVTIMEALVLGKTVISTDIVGPRAFLQQGYGYLVEESADALADEMCKFMEGALPPAKFFDAEEFNRKAIAEFDEIFK